MSEEWVDDTLRIILLENELERPPARVSPYRGVDGLDWRYEDSQDQLWQSMYEAAYLQAAWLGLFDQFADAAKQDEIEAKLCIFAEYNYSKATFPSLYEDEEFVELSLNVALVELMREIGSSDDPESRSERLKWAKFMFRQLGKPSFFYADYEFNDDDVLDKFLRGYADGNLFERAK